MGSSEKGYALNISIQWQTWWYATEFSDILFSDPYEAPLVCFWPRMVLVPVGVHSIWTCFIECLDGFLQDFFKVYLVTMIVQLGMNVAHSYMKLKYGRNYKEDKIWYEFEYISTMVSIWTYFEGNCNDILRYFFQGPESDYLRIPRGFYQDLFQNFPQGPLQDHAKPSDRISLGFSKKKIFIPRFPEKKNIILRKLYRIIWLFSNSRIFYKNNIIINI